MDGFVDTLDAVQKIREGKSIIKVQASLDTAYLHNLKLTKEEVFLSTNINADIKGLTLMITNVRVNKPNFIVFFLIVLISITVAK